MHEPVLLQEVVNNLRVRTGGKYIDGTLGAGGHTEAILAAGGAVLGVEADPEMLALAKKRLGEREELRVALGNFVNIDKIAVENGFGQADGILLDLGVSNIHFQQMQRGFSFRDEGQPLDMRLNPDVQKVSAKELINMLSEKQLISLFAGVTGKAEAVRLSRAIVAGRPASSVGDFLRIGGYTKKVGRIHPATKAFLALRIAVNSELTNLREALPKAYGLLVKGGRLLVITFHSLEEGIVKEFFKMKKPIVPIGEEITRNPKARSAKLWVWAKN